MEKLEEIVVIRAASEWLNNPEVLDTIRKQPAITYERLPSLSVQAEVAVAIKFLSEPRLKSKEDQDWIEKLVRAMIHVVVSPLMSIGIAYVAKSFL